MTTTSTLPAVQGATLVPTSRLILTWTRFEMRIWLREPAAVLLNMAYPLIMMVFFLASSPQIRTDSAAAVSLVGHLTLVGTLMVCLNFPANGIPEARASNFYAFCRTLPLGPVPRLVAWIVAPVLCALISATVTIGVGISVTAAKFSGGTIGFIVAAALALAVPTTVLGLAIGFVLPRKTALAVSLTLAFTMILLGGISGLPTPGWVESASRFLPSGSTGNLMSSLIGDQSVTWWNVLVLLAWTIAGIAWSVMAYRRDKGQKYH